MLSSAAQTITMTFIRVNYNTYLLKVHCTVIVYELRKQRGEESQRTMHAVIDSSKENKVL